jgi:MFS superfamily sulfate permease-like transporter
MAVVYLPPRARSLPERIAYGIVAACVLVLGFFFLAAAIVAGVVLAAVVLVRYWWARRQLGKAAGSEVLTAEYTVVERDRDGLPPAPGNR